MASKQSQFTAIDAVAEKCTGSHGMERKGTSAQKQAGDRGMHPEETEPRGKGRACSRERHHSGNVKCTVWQEHGFQGGAMGERRLERWVGGRSSRAGCGLLWHLEGNETY